MTSLINANGRVVAAVDLSKYADSVAEHAAWAAARIAAPLELLHVIERATHADIRHRHGALVDTLLGIESGVRLFVLGKRGEHADFAKGHLGSNLERVMRAVHRPVLVAARAFQPIDRFMIAFDGSATTRRCVELVCVSPLLKGLQCHVVMVGDAEAARPHLDRAQAQLQAAGFDARGQIIPGSPEAVIAQQVAEHAINLLVMGAYGHSRIRSLIVGSTTTQVLRGSQIPMLLLR